MQGKYVIDERRALDLVVECLVWGMSVCACDVRFVLEKSKWKE